LCLRRFRSQGASSQRDLLDRWSRDAAPPGLLRRRPDQDGVHAGLSPRWRDSAEPIGLRCSLSSVPLPPAIGPEHRRGTISPKQMAADHIARQFGCEARRDGEYLLDATTGGKRSQCSADCARRALYWFGHWTWRGACATESVLEEGNKDDGSGSPFHACGCVIYRGRPYAWSS